MGDVVKPDPIGTTRTPFAVSTDEESWYVGNTREDAIARAMQDAEDRVEQGDVDWTPTVEVFVWRDVLWCVGSRPGFNDCYCGGDHDEHVWLGIDWTQDAVEEHALDVLLKGDGDAR